MPLARAEYPLETGRAEHAWPVTHRTQFRPVPIRRDLCRRGQFCRPPSEDDSSGPPVCSLYPARRGVTKALF